MGDDAPYAEENGGWDRNRIFMEDRYGEAREATDIARCRTMVKYADTSGWRNVKIYMVGTELEKDRERNIRGINNPSTFNDPEFEENALRNTIIKARIG